MIAHAVATAAAVVLGAAPALAASSSPYDAFDQTAYLAYLNAPEANGDLMRPPRLRISFGGGRSYDVVMDTGSSTAPYNHLELGSPMYVDYVWGRQIGEYTINP